MPSPDFNQTFPHPAADPVPVRAILHAGMGQPSIEYFHLSSSRMPAALPAGTADWDAERFNDAQGGEAEPSSELARAEAHWDVPTALDEPGFVSAGADSEYVDGVPQCFKFGESVCGVPCGVEGWAGQDFGECFNNDMDVDFDVKPNAVEPYFDRPNLSLFKAKKFNRRFNNEYGARVQHPV